MHFVVGEGASSGPLLEAVLGTLLNAIEGPLAPPRWDLGIHEIQVKIWTRNRTPFGHGF